jgi:hypothetical protein
MFLCVCISSLYFNNCAIVHLINRMLCSALHIRIIRIQSRMLMCMQHFLGPFVNILRTRSTSNLKRCRLNQRASASEVSISWSCMTNWEGGFKVISLHLIGVSDAYHEQSYANSAIQGSLKYEARVSTTVYISAFIMSRLVQSVTPDSRDARFEPGPGYRVFQRSSSWFSSVSLGKYRDSTLN